MLLFSYDSWRYGQFVYRTLRRKKNVHSVITWIFIGSLYELPNKSKKPGLLRVGVGNAFVRSLSSDAVSYFGRYCSEKKKTTEVNTRTKTHFLCIAERMRTVQIYMRYSYVVWLKFRNVEPARRWINYIVTPTARTCK